MGGGVKGRDMFEYAKYSKITADRNSVMNMKINLDHVSFVQGRYDYSALQEPVTKLYQEGNFGGALLYQGFVLSGQMNGGHAKDSEFIKGLKPIQQKELGQVMLDNGRMASTNKVLEPIKNTMTSGKNQETFEEIQALNNKLIAQFISGADGAKQDAQRLVNFQSQENLKYKSTIEKFKKDNKTDSKGVTASAMPDLRNKLNQMDTSQKLLSKVKVATPYLNSSADFLYAYASEQQYLKDEKSGSASDWTAVRNSFANIANNVKSRNTRVMKRQTRRAPKGKYQVVYALVATGFAPHKELSYNKFTLYVNGSAVPLSLSLTNLAPTGADYRYNIRVNKQKLEQIASPGQSVAKYFKDTYRYEWLSQGAKALATAYATVAAEQLAKNSQKKSSLMGDIMGSVVGHTVNAVGSHMSLPDMTSWTTMPQNIYATRLQIPRDKHAVTLSINGQKQTIKFDPSQKIHFVYARVANKHTQVYSSK